MKKMSLFGPPSLRFLTFVWKEKSTQLNFDGDKWFLMDFRNEIMQSVKIFICVFVESTPTYIYLELKTQDPQQSD